MDARNENVLAMVLAGGEGTRLSPLTAPRSKPAVPFGGRYRIERLMASAGYFGTMPALVFATVQLLLPVAVFALIMSYWRSGGALPFAVLGAMLTYFLPNLWLGRAIEKRKRGKKKALSVLEAKLGRTVYHLWRKQVPFDAKRFLAS